MTLGFWKACSLSPLPLLFLSFYLLCVLEVSCYHSGWLDTHNGTPEGLKFKTSLLRQPPKCQNYRCAVPHPNPTSFMGFCLHNPIPLNAVTWGTGSTHEVQWYKHLGRSMGSSNYIQVIWNICVRSTTSIPIPESFLLHIIQGKW